VDVLPDVFIFRRGETNGDHSLDVSDAVTILGYLFLGAAPPTYFDAADANDDGALDLRDASTLLGYLLLGGEAPPPPFTEAGEDPTADALGCLFRDGDRRAGFRQTNEMASAIRDAFWRCGSQRPPLKLRRRRSTSRRSAQSAAE
jgi:hypothetical protein